MNIIQSEFYKLKKTKLYYICVLVCAVLGVFLTYAIQMGVGRGGVNLSSIANSLSGVEVLEKTLGLSFIPIIIAAFVSIFVSFEFQNGTMKNYVAKGMNRFRIYLSKLVVCVAAVLTMYAVYVVISCFMGTILWGFNPHGVATVANMAAMVLGEGLLLLAYSSVFVFVSFWLRSIGASIAVNICIVSLLPTFLIAINYIVGDNVVLSDYWISGNISALATLSPESGAVLQGTIVALFYIVSGSIAGCLLFKRQDIK